MLFKDSNRLKDYAEFNEVNYASVKLTIRQVESNYLVPILGNELYSKLNNAYTLATSEEALTSSIALLLDNSRMLIGAYVAYNFSPKAEVQLSDAGLRRAETSTLKTAYGYQGENFREQKLIEGENAAETLFLFLDTNRASYPEWTASTSFSNYQSLFIKSGSDFDVQFKTASPYRNYWAWRYKMKEIEETAIRKALTDAVFDDLKAKDQAGSPLSTEEAQLMFRVKKAIAYLTVAAALPYHTVRIDSNGLSIISPSPDNNKQQRTAASGEVLSTLITTAGSSGKEWVDKSIELLHANPVAFPLYPVPEPTIQTTPGNECTVGSFGLY